jgi:prepilin-type processing-associated H-X9-DG protein
VFSAYDTPNNKTVPDQNWTCKMTTHPLAPCTSTSGGNRYNLARSWHEGGVHVTMADGSVRWVSENIGLSLYQALATRRGMEPIGEF